MTLPAGEAHQSHVVINFGAASSLTILRPLHPLLQGHTDRTFSEYLADRPMDVQNKARERRVCLIYARERAKDAPNAGIAKAYAQTASEVEGELVALLHATRPADPVPFPEPPVHPSHGIEDLLVSCGQTEKRHGLKGILRLCADLLPGGQNVH
ncbi:hypothetical protein [Gluconobacter oxydans]|uniref:hypothetical protein n=1 Tax=Gluconobacter oxydans TaxID=442 RepID=UPI001CD88561|nr:hypothetical protein [Gluconobacter oxydans]